MESRVNKQCSLVDCNREFYAKGLCKRHYQKANNAENYEQRLAHRREYFRRNKEKYQEANRRRNNSIKGQYRSLVWAAKTRGIHLSLTLSDLEEIRKWPCFYCDGPLSPSGSGLDRISNDKAVGYCASNVLPCCKECNLIRNNFLTVTEMRLVAQTLKAHRQGKAA